MGSVDVAAALARYQDAPVEEPMHGQPGQIRRNPSADEKKVRRQMGKQQKKASVDEVASVSSIAGLLREAERTDSPAARAELIAKAGELQLQRVAAYDAERALDLTLKESVAIVPRPLHELHSTATDWVLDQVIGSVDTTEADHAMIAEASLWYERVPDIVKDDPEEFAFQASNKARKLGSAYGDYAENAVACFVTETQRRYRQDAPTRKSAALVHDLSDPNGGMVEDPGMGDARFRPDTGSEDKQPVPQPSPGFHSDHTPLEPASLAEHAEPGPIEHELGRHLRGEDAEGVREMGEGFARNEVYGSLQRTAARVSGEDDELVSVLAGLLGEVEHVADALDDGQQVRADSDADVAQQLNPTTAGVEPVGAHGVGGTAGAPLTTAQMFVDNPNGIDTASTRAPTLQEIADYEGWTGTSVVPQGDSGAAALDQNDQGFADASVADQLAGQFPVGGGAQQQTHAAKVAAQLIKESSMDQAQCPTCGGHGTVAVRKQAYSGLPQIDQIVNADETPGTEPAPGQAENYPTQVAFPLNPNWGTGGDVSGVIQQTEQQIAQRPQGVGGAPGMPVGPGGSVAASVHQANGRDDSGWAGDMGAKGPNYPGYSDPGPAYDGSHNLGYPDPIYGYGGDHGENRPLKPYGASEADDFTNGTGQPYDPSVPHDDGQAYRTVSPSLSTSGSWDPVIAAAQEEIVRQQRAIAARSAQLASR